MGQRYLQRNWQILHGPERLRTDIVLRERGKAFPHELSEEKTQPEAISTGN